MHLYNISEINNVTQGVDRATYIESKPLIGDKHELTHRHDVSIIHNTEQGADRSIAKGLIDLWQTSLDDNLTLMHRIVMIHQGSTV